MEDKCVGELENISGNIPKAFNNSCVHPTLHGREVLCKLQVQGGFQLFIQAFDDDEIRIDDHLDDIFVGGSLTDSTLTSAMTITGAHNRVSVTVQFQRTCDANYYGVSCFTYCVPADNDADGHFTCDASDGSKLCLPGYSNPDNNCRDNINDCASGPCQNSGHCTDLLADFACTCPPGYTGKECSVDRDDCQKAYCPVNTTCVDYIDAFTCVCNPGYTGENCTKVLDPCESGPCDNGGTCVVVDPFSSMCVCLAGYTDPVCEVNIDECLTADCPRGTSCQDDINSFHCVQQSLKMEKKTITVILVGTVIGVITLLLLGSCILLAVLFMCRRMRHRETPHPESRDTVIYDEITYEKSLQALPNVSYGCTKFNKETNRQNDSNALCDIKKDMPSCKNAASSMTIPTQPNASYGNNFFLDKSKKYDI